MASSHWILVLRCTAIAIAVAMFAVEVPGGEARFIDNPWGIRIVNITNDLCPGTELFIHCASGDDDLGSHVLRFRSSFHWKFKTNWFGTTLFWCKVRWDGHYKLFDIFDVNRDKPKCEKKCWWSIQKDGGYMFDERYRNYTMLFQW